MYEAVFRKNNIGAYIGSPQTNGESTIGQSQEQCPMLYGQTTRTMLIETISQPQDQWYMVVPLANHKTNIGGSIGQIKSMSVDEFANYKSNVGDSIDKPQDHSQINTKSILVAPLADGQPQKQC